MFLQVRLVFGNHPDRPHDVETPATAEEDKEDLFAEGNLGRDRDQPEDRENDHRPERDEIRGERNEEVRLIRHDVTTLRAHPHVTDAAETEVDEKGVRELVAEHVEVEKLIAQEAGKKPGDHQNDSCGKADEFRRFVKVGQKMRIAYPLKKREDGDEAEGSEDQQGDRPAHHPAGPGNMEIMVADELVARLCDRRHCAHPSAASGSDVLHVTGPLLRQL